MNIIHAGEEPRRERIELIDAMRGISVVLMVMHHLLYNLVYFLDAPGWLFSNPVFDVLHYIFAGLFITLSGVSSRFSHSNVKRGIKVIILAIGITVVTHLMDMPILFGVLHLLGFSMLFFGLTGRWWDKISEKAAPFIYVALIVFSALATAHIALESDYLWMFGWWNAGFLSYDYFPILPWFFVFMFGTSLGVYINARKFPAWFYVSY
ncbi:MAG: DUF1624 domain-containing protein, partial [Oscillospiraceae bacterium]|nr:DUF1624 domain-containing protein [Oscillospiraceae bacterium]